MKLIIAIVQDEISEAVSHALVTHELRVTRIASTGGFLRRGSTTLVIGVEDELVEKAIGIIRETCPPAKDATQKRATLFVLNVGHYEQI